jgi:cell division protein FtsB
VKLKPTTAQRLARGYTVVQNLLAQNEQLRRKIARLERRAAITDLDIAARAALKEKL